MTIDRRTLARMGLLGGVAAAAPALALAQASPQAPDAQCPSRLSRLGLLGPDDPVPEVGSIGSGASRPEQVRHAFRLLWNCPRAPAGTLEIARYFQGLTDNVDGNIYNEEWPEPEANPLITSLFGLTSTAPNDGDQTSWCSAFASFVLNAAGKKSKYTAWALGYRNYGPRRDEPGQGENLPQPGDIVLFRRLNAEGVERGGHIGFFVSETEGAITVLGGNQGPAGRGAVTESVFQRRSRTMPLVACYAPEAEHV